MPKPKKFKRIVVALWMGNASGRDILSGALRYAKERKNWQITLLLLPNGFSSALLNQVHRDGYDGILTTDPTNKTILELTHNSSVPLVAIGPKIPIARPHGGSVLFVSRQDGKTGETAANYFLSLGRFNSFWYVQSIDAGQGETSEREEGFRESLSKAGIVSESFSSFTAPGATNSAERLLSWLKAIKKPAAVMCFYDPPAVQVLNACQKLGIAVPTQVAILGVDNDEFVCETATPTLSSIQPDHEAIGYHAACELDAAISLRKGCRKKLHVLQPTVVERDTTKPIAPSAKLVQHALAYIATNATKGISVQDVVTELKVSRRLADLRFREIQGTSIHDAIEKQKLEVASKLLLKTTLSVSRIGEKSGYASLQTFDSAFKRRFNCSPREFRGLKVSGTSGRV